jgi:hypothetical protein
MKLHGENPEYMNEGKFIDTKRIMTIPSHAMQ